MPFRAPELTGPIATLDTAPRALPWDPPPNSATINDPQLRRFLEASEPQVEDEDERRGWRPSPNVLRRALRYLVVAVVLVAAVIVLRVYIVSPYYIPSESMEPTLHGCSGCSNDRVLVDKLSYRLHAIHDGDIVVFHRPKSAGPEITDKVLIKRVIAVGGETVSIRDGHVYRDDKLLKESYVQKTDQCQQQSTEAHGSTSTWTIPHNQVFVLGDNRCDSEDSRYFGPIPDSSVIGRAFLIIWPVGHIKFL